MFIAAAAIAACALLSCAGLLWAAHPFSAHDAATVPFGTLELEMAADRVGSESGLTATVTVGLTPSVDAAVGVAMSREGRGWSTQTDPALTLKWVFAGPDNRRPALAVVASRIPEPDAGICRHVVLAGTLELGRGVVHANIGRAWVANPEDPDEHIWAVAFERPVASRLSAVFEVCGSRKLNPVDDDRCSEEYLAGFIYAARNGWALSAALAARPGDPEARTRATLGLTKVF